MSDVSLGFVFLEEYIGKIKLYLDHIDNEILMIIFGQVFLDQVMGELLEKYCNNIPEDKRDTTYKKIERLKPIIKALKVEQSDIDKYNSLIDDLHNYREIRNNAAHEFLLNEENESKLNLLINKYSKLDGMDSYKELLIKLALDTKLLFNDWVLTRFKKT